MRDPHRAHPDSVGIQAFTGKALREGFRQKPPARRAGAGVGSGKRYTETVDPPPVSSGTLDGDTGRPSPGHSTGRPQHQAMLFEVLSKASFRRLVELLLDANEVVAPRVVGQGRGGKPVHQFLPIDGFEDMSLDYDQTEYSAKTYFLPFKEKLCSMLVRAYDPCISCSVH